MPLVISFVRYRGARDHIYVQRSNGTTCDWAFPTYGDQLPHDLCHLVVEQLLEIANGFWGLVEDGMEIRLVQDQGTLVKDGRPITERSDIDLSGLVRAEEAVALLTAEAGARATSADVKTERRTDRSPLGFLLPACSRASAIEEILERLRGSGDQWRNLSDGEAVTLEYVRPRG